MTIISFKTNKNTEWEELADLPTPINLNTMHRDRKIQWCIDGFFGTSKGREYFNDVREKLSLVLKADIDYSYQTKEYFKHTHKLSDFYLEDLRIAKPKYWNSSATTDDTLFEALRHEAMKLKRQGCFSSDALQSYGESIVGAINFKKVGYKVKNITKWIEYYNPKSKKIRVSVNNRTDNAMLQSKKRHETSYQRYLDYLEGCEMFDPEALKDSSSKMAKELGISWRTIKKYELKVIKNRLNTVRDNAMTFIGSIRGYTLSSSLFKLRVNSTIPCIAYRRTIDSLINSVYGIISIDTFRIKDMLWQDHHFQKT